MTREEAIKELETIKMCEVGTVRQVQALDVALSALRPVSREQVERIWFREPYSRLETRQGDDGSIVYSAVNTCMACGSKTPIGHFCHNCGVALDDWGVDMMLERWKEAVNGDRPD